MTSEFNEMGPIDYLVVAFPGSRLTGEGLALLVDLVDRGIIRILDLAFVGKLDDGSVVALDLSALDGGDELAVFEGASSGLLDQGDLEEAAEALSPGDSAGVLIYENVWAAPFAAALRRSGGRLVAGGRIPVQEILRALDELESAST